MLENHFLVSKAVMGLFEDQFDIEHHWFFKQQKCFYSTVSSKLNDVPSKVTW